MTLSHHYESQGFLMVTMATS